MQDLVDTVENKAELDRQIEIEQTLVDLSKQLSRLSGGFDSVKKDFTKLDDDVKREFRGVRSEVRESKIEVIKDSSVKLEKVIELTNFC